MAFRLAELKALAVRALDLRRVHLMCADANAVQRAKLALTAMVCTLVYTAADCLVGMTVHHKKHPPCFGVLIVWRKMLFLFSCFLRRIQLFLLIIGSLFYHCQELIPAVLRNQRIRTHFSRKILMLFDVINAQIIFI